MDDDRKSCFEPGRNGGQELDQTGLDADWTELVTKPVCTLGPPALVASQQLQSSGDRTSWKNYESINDYLLLKHAASSLAMVRCGWAVSQWR